MTELVPVLALVVPALPLACALALQATRTPAQADRLNVVAAARDRGRPRWRWPRRRSPAAARRRCAATSTSLDGRQRRVPGADRDRRPVQRARLARLPAHGRAQLVQRRALAPLVLRRAVRLLGGAARRADRRQPRARLAAGRGDDGRLGAAGRVHRPAPRARGRLEVPRAHDARACRSRCSGSSCSPLALSRHRQRGPGRARLARAGGQRRRPAARRRRWSRSC